MCIRYVDNRGTCYDPELQRLASFRRFLSPLFYEFPIELEDCGNDVFLGYKIDLSANECTWIVPEEPHAYRSVKSAGTVSRLLSGLQARLHLLYRGTFPRALAAPLVKKLLQHYVDQGFQTEDLHRVAFRVSSIYRNKSRRTCHHC